MATLTSRQVVLVARPEAIPEAEHFAVVESEVPSPGPGEIVVRNRYLSVDPAMRGWVSAVANYSDPVPIGGVMRSFAVGTVIESASVLFAPGDQVMGMFGWQEVAVVDASVVIRRVADDGLSPSLALGVLGLTGVTAWFGMTEICAPRAGETVVVSTAAGAVGSVAGQVAKLAGARTVGIAGGAEKVRLCLDEFGYDAAVDYRSPTFEADLVAACANGVDAYYDNTSGAISDAVMRLLNVHARIAICGTAAISSWDPWPVGPVVTRHLLTKRARMQGFVYFDYEHRLDEALASLAPLVRDGSIRYREDVLEGIGSAPGSIAGLYRGDNLGKRVIRL